MKSRFEMSLAQQFADLDRAYRHCCQDKLTLQARVAALEQLVSDYKCYLVDYDYGQHTGAHERFQLILRTEALLHEGKEEP